MHPDNDNKHQKNVQQHRFGTAPTRTNWRTSITLLYNHKLSISALRVTSKRPDPGLVGLHPVHWWTKLSLKNTRGHSRKTERENTNKRNSSTNKNNKNRPESTGWVPESTIQKSYYFKNCDKFCGNCNFPDCSSLILRRTRRALLKAWSKFKSDFILLKLLWKYK